MARFFIHLGALGLFLLGVIDGPLFVPFGIDLLLISLISRHPGETILYVACATIGSTIGYLIVDFLGRKGGKEGLRRELSVEKYEKVRRRMESRAGLAIAVALLIPPPFPVTPVIAGAAAFQYPRRKLASILASARLVRFGVAAVLARNFGSRLIRIMQAPAFRWFIIAVIVASFAGSGLVIYRWIRGRSKRDQPAPAPSS